MQYLILCGRLIKFCKYHDEEVALQMVHLLVRLLQHVFAIHCGRGTTTFVLNIQKA